MAHMKTPTCCPQNHAQPCMYTVCAITMSHSHSALHYVLSKATKSRIWKLQEVASLPQTLIHISGTTGIVLCSRHCPLLKALSSAQDLALTLQKTEWNTTWKMITTRNMNKDTAKEMLPMMIPSLLKRWASLDAFLASSYLPSPLCRLTCNK